MIPHYHFRMLFVVLSVFYLFWFFLKHFFFFTVYTILSIGSVYTIKFLKHCFCFLTFHLELLFPCDFLGYFLSVEAFQGCIDTYTSLVIFSYLKKRKNKLHLKPCMCVGGAFQFELGSNGDN